MNITQRIVGRVPETTMQAARQELMPLARPRGFMATLRFAWVCAKAAWICAREASR